MQRITAGLLVGLGLLGAWREADAADRVNIQAVVTETYDSNVARSDPTLAAARGVSLADSIVQPALDIDILLPVSRQSVFLKGSAGYTFYGRNRELNNGQVDLQGGVNGQFRTCKATVTGDFSYQQSDLEYLSLVATRNVENDKSIGLDGSCGGRIGFAPTFSVSQRWSDNSSPELLSSDYQDTRASAGLAYRRPVLGEVSLYFSYDQVSFPNRDLLVESGDIEDGYRTYGVGLRYDRHFGSKLEGSVRVAYTSLRSDDQATAGFHGVTYGADVTFHFSHLLQARVMLERDVTPTIRPDVTYEVGSNYSAEGDYSVGPKLKLVAGASGGDNRYNGADIINGADIASENLWALYGSVHYQLNRRIGLQLDARHEVRDANVSDFSYTDTRVGLSIMAGI